MAYWIVLHDDLRGNIDGDNNGMVYRRRNPLRARRCHSDTCEDKMILDTVKLYARSQIPGFAAGAGLVLAIAVTLFVLSRPAPVRDVPKPFVTPGTGAPARVDEPRRDGDTIQYPLSYDDAGSSTLNVPVDSIPEARAWRRDVWSTTAFYFSDGTVGLLKGYRYNRLMISAGLWGRIPRLELPAHFRARSDPDAGIAFAFTLFSKSPLF